jgi:hypothetical protein
MRAAASVVAVLLAALVLAACGRGETESTLTKADVQKKLTGAPVEGFKRLRTASCAEEDTKNRYRCDVTTEDGDDAVLLVIADGDEINIDSAQTK